MACYEDDAGLKRRLSAERYRQQTSEQRNVVGSQRVTARLERVQGLAVAKEDGGLVLLHNQLRAELDIRRAALGNPMNQLGSGLVEILQNFNCHALLLELSLLCQTYAAA